MWDQEGVTFPKAKADRSSWKVPLMVELSAHGLVYNHLFDGVWLGQGEGLN